MLRSVFRNFALIGAADIANRAVSFVFLIYVARQLDPRAFGEFLVIGTYVTFFSMTFMAGLMPVAVREIVRQRDDPVPVLEQVLSLRLVLGVGAYVMLLLAAAFVLPAQTFLPLAAVAGTGLIADAFRDSFTAYHNAFETMAAPSAFQLLTGVLTAASGVAALALDGSVLMLLAAVATVNIMLTAAWHILFSRRVCRYRVRFHVGAWKNMLVKVAPIAPVQLAGQFNRLASVMMLSVVPGMLTRESAVGLFGPAQHIAYAPLAMLFGLRRAIIPPIVRQLQRGESVSEPFTVAMKTVIVFLCFPLVVATSFFAADILSLLFGARYVESARTLEWLAVGAAFWIVAMIPESLVISHHQHRYKGLLAVALVPLLVNLALCLVLIPAFSMAGAACAMVVSRAAYLALVLHYCRTLLPREMPRPARLVPALTLLAAAYAACAFVVAHVEPLVTRSLAVGGIACLAMLAAGHRELIGLVRAVLRRQRA